MTRAPANSPTGRNDPCPCGSGRKYKQCCLKRAPAGAAPSSARPAREDDLAAARRFLGAGNLAQARALYHAHLEHKPRDASALFEAGQVEAELGGLDDGIALLRRAVEANARRAQYHGVLADLLLRARDPAGSERAAQRALALDRQEPNAHRALALQHESMSRFDDALSSINRAIAADQRHADAGLVKARILLRLHDGEGSLRLTDELIARGGAPEYMTRVRNARAFALEALDRPGEAFAEFEEAGATALRSSRARMLDANYWTRVAADLVANTTADTLGRFRQTPDSSEAAPVFLAGFPRSGTTLAEQILAGHPDVITSDEAPILAAALRSLHERDEMPSRALAGLTGDDVAALRTLYRARASELLGPRSGDSTVIDKDPIHTGYLPIIGAIFPGARALVILRDPRDVCLSCLKQDFLLTTTTMHFTSLARTVEQYVRIMGLYHDVRDRLPLEVTEIRYEDLVEMPDRNGAERLIEAAGLPWHDAVLEYRDRAASRFITTPSAAAVRQRTHGRAIGGWARYADQLEPYMHLLEPFIRRFAYE